MMRWNKAQNKIIAVSIPHLLYQLRNIGLTFILTAIFCSIINIGYQNYKHVLQRYW